MTPGRRADLIAGSGTDTLIASRLVGDSGKVWALDITPAMLTKLRATLHAADIRNVEVLEGDAERIPLPDNTVDVVTSNGVLNLVPDKRKAFGEAGRRRAEEIFGWSAIAHQTAKLYESLTKKK